MRRRPLIYGLGAPVLLFVAVGLFWYFRALESGTETPIDLGIVDLYTDDVLIALQAPDFDPRAAVLLEEPPEGAASPTAAAGPPGDVTMTTYTPEYMELATRMSAPGFLVLGDISYPGWKAFVDGHEVPILRANYLFRAVRLEPGRAEVRFEYRPRSFRLGVAFAVATGLAIGVAMLVALRRGPSVVSDNFTYR